MSGKMSGYFQFDNLISPVANDANTNTGLYRSMKEYAKGCVIVAASLGNGNNCTCQLVQAEANNGLNAANVSGYSIVLTGSAQGNQVGALDFDVSALNNSTPYVGVNCNLQNASDLVAAILLRGDARYLKGAANNTTGATQHDE